MDRLRRSARRLLLAAGSLILTATSAVAPPVAGAAGASPGGGRHDSLGRELLAKAAPDACFDGIGVAYPPGPPCQSGQAKVNQSYVWGLTKAGDDLWFGTGANVNCLTSARNLKSTTPILNDDYVCEYGESQVAKANPTLPAAYGDFRSPQVFVYGLSTRQLTERTPDIRAASPTDAQRLATTAGLRAAGSFHGVAFLGGPALGASINLFAFDTDTGAYLGSENFPGYGNIRHFVIADGALYAGVGVGANGGTEGHVLRWAGGKTDPFRFVNVANLPGQAADLTVHQGRVFVTTWGSRSADGKTVTSLAAVMMSPPLDDGEAGLTEADADGWSEVWNVGQYEPDPLIASTYALGGLASYGGDLFWGTMHVPLKATVLALAAHPPADDAAAAATVRNTQRAIGIFRGRGLGTSREKTELLYGAARLPTYDPSADDGAGGWVTADTGYTPRYGPSGFGNPFLNYTWTMVVAEGRLFVGTMDWSYLKKDVATGGDDGLPDPSRYYGGDLWMFPSPQKAAIEVDGAGLGNYLNYGIRTMVADGSRLYLGMANPMNLRADPGDEVPEGGWELIAVTRTSGESQEHRGRKDH